MAIGIHTPVMPHSSSAARETYRKAVQMDQQISDRRLREKDETVYRIAAD